MVHNVFIGTVFIFVCFLYVYLKIILQVDHHAGFEAAAW